MSTTATYGIRKSLSCSFEEAVPKVKAALAGEGFGILTEIDVQGTLKKKLNVEFKKYVILGACNPQIAYKTLQAEMEVGLLLPCNVIVYEDANKQTVVSAIDPVKMLEIVDNPDLQENARTVKEMLAKAVSTLQS
jgi:uncharacterized protein (DUF302 family)